jgi:hypothetical protein
VSLGLSKLRIAPKCLLHYDSGCMRLWKSWIPYDDSIRSFKSFTKRCRRTMLLSSRIVSCMMTLLTPVSLVDKDQLEALHCEVNGMETALILALRESVKGDKETVEMRNEKLKSELASLRDKTQMQLEQINTWVSKRRC